MRDVNGLSGYISERQVTATRVDSSESLVAKRAPWIPVNCVPLNGLRSGWLVIQLGMLTVCQVAGEEMQTATDGIGSEINCENTPYKFYDF